MTPTSTKGNTPGFKHRSLTYGLVRITSRGGGGEMQKRGPGGLTEDRGSSSTIGRPAAKGLGMQLIRRRGY